MKKYLAIILAMAMMVGIFVGCANPDAKKEENPAEKVEENKGEEKPAETGEKQKIALLTDQAGTQVFVLSMIDGLKDSAKKYNFEPVVAESPDAAAFEDNGRALVEEETDLIIGGGWPAGEAIEKIATEFPDKAKYALIDSEVEAENVKCISYREQEGAYLIGLMAALVTEPDDNMFGAVHVNQGAGSWKWRYGFMEGVKSVKPDAKFVFNYVGNYNDPAKAKEYAIQQYEQGAKFINAAAAGGDKGVFEAAKEKGFYTAGQDVDLTSPDNPYVLSCQIKDTYATVEHLLDLYFSGKEWTFDNEVFGLEQGTIGAVHVTHESKNPPSEKLTEEILGKLKAAAEDIKTGKLDLKNIPNEEDYK